MFCCVLFLFFTKVSENLKCKKIEKMDLLFQSHFDTLKESKGKPFSRFLLKFYLFFTLFSPFSRY